METSATRPGRAITAPEGARDDDAPPGPAPGTPLDDDAGAVSDQLAAWVAGEVVAVAERLGAADVDVEPPAGHPGALALCVVEAVWAPRLRPSTVAGVVDRVRGRLADGAAAGVGGEPGSPAHLLASLAAAGGDDAWAASAATRHRVAASADAPLKATAVRAGAEVLLEAGIATTGDLLELLRRHRAVPVERAGRPGPGGARTPAAEPTRWEEVRTAWCSVPGQRSGRSWHRLHLLAGAEQVVPDEDVRRFASRCLHGLLAGGREGPAPRAGARPEAAVAAQLLERAAEALGAPARLVDHVVWRGELLRERRPRPAARSAPGAARVQLEDA